MMSEEEFEEKYRKIKKGETPDLWSRIETRLEGEVTPSRRKKNTKKWIISCSTLVASILIFFLASPLFSVMEGNQEGSENKEAINEIESITSDFNNLSDGFMGNINNKETDGSNLADSHGNDEGEDISQYTDRKDSVNGEEESLELEKETESNWNKIVAALRKNGIGLKKIDTDIDTILGLEVIKAKNMPNELQNMVEELRKLDESPIYYIDLNNVYYVKIGDNIYRITI